MGSGGSILFFTPSSPAISMAQNARYGLHVGSGVRNSRRLAAGVLKKTGIRTHADRFRCEYTRLIGRLVARDQPPVASSWSGW